MGYILAYNPCGICEKKMCSMCELKMRRKGAINNDWVSVEDHLPDEFESVLGHMTDAEGFPPVRECYLVGGAFFFPALNDVHPVSHWMPLPEAPKMKGGS